jgi:hypothetical protein
MNQRTIGLMLATLMTAGCNLPKEGETCSQIDESGCDGKTVYMCWCDEYDQDGYCTDESTAVWVEDPYCQCSGGEISVCS